METRHTRNLVAAGPTFDFILVPFLQICFSFSSPCGSPFRFCVIWYYFFFCQFGRVNCNWPLHFLCQSTRQPKTSRRTAADNEKKVPGLTKKKKINFYDDNHMESFDYRGFELTQWTSFNCDIPANSSRRNLYGFCCIWIWINYLPKES